MELPTVERVDDNSGSHIEPPCDDAWSPAEKLAWHAAVVAVDTGLRVHVRQADHGYQLQVGNQSMSTMPYLDAWLFLSGVTVGATEAWRL